MRTHNRQPVKQERTTYHDDDEAGSLLPPPSKTPATVAMRSTTPVSVAPTTPALATTTDSSSSRLAALQDSSAARRSPTIAPDNRDGDVDMVNAPVSVTPSVMERLGSSSRKLIQAVQRLEALNIDATLESVPKFVVIGDQSAGKSSVIEAICDIQLPRNEGTCTRCPYQISTTSSGPNGSWSCKITLVNKYSYYEQARAGQDGASFDRWVDKDTEIFDFVVLHNKKDLEAALYRAQLAVLNPHQKPSTFLNVPITRGQVHQQKVGFAPNIISLEIAAPNLPDLSFYDLPGAINTMGDESQEFLVEFVERLLKKYMDDKEARIVLACSANQDLEVSTALRFLRQWKASHRTIGVLTKPDLVDMTPAKVKFFEDLLLGKQYRFGGGWFVTRQLSQRELTGESILTHEQARQIESTFFSAGPWSTTLDAHAYRFGISNLQKCISRELTDDIIRKLPSIVARVQARISAINEELATIPEQAAPQTASLTVITAIDSVKTALIAEVNANSNQSELRKKYRETFRNFSTKLRELKPEVDWVTPGYVKPAILVDDSDEEESPSKRSRTNQGSRAISATPKRASKTRRTPASSEITQVKFRLNEVKRSFDSSPGGDIPDQVNDAVVRSLTLQPLSISSNITDRLVKKIREECIQRLERVITAALEQRSTTELYRQVLQSAKSLFEQLLQEVTDIVCRLVAATCHRPIAYNPWLRGKRAFYEAENLRLRRKQRVDEHYAMLEADGQRVPNLLEQEKKAADPGWVSTTLGADDFEREVKALADPLAYYDVASAQLVDTIAQQFEWGLMAAYESRLGRQLLQDLRATDPDHCVTLLAEDPEREVRREELLAERVKLEQALTELEALPEAHA